MNTPHSHLIERMRAERRVAEAMVHFGLGGSVEENAAEIGRRREHREMEEAPYLKPTPERVSETVGGCRI